MEEDCTRRSKHTHAGDDGVPGGVLRVAVPRPLQGLLDYRWPTESEGSRPHDAVGRRVRVPLGRGTAVGIVVATAASSEVPASRLRPALQWLDPDPLLPTELLETLHWAAAYYHYPIGTALATALPGPLRQGRSARAGEAWWRLCGEWTAVPDELARAPQQRALFRRLLDAGGGAPVADLITEDEGWRRAGRVLQKNGWIARSERPAPDAPAPAAPPHPSLPPLNEGQQAAVSAYHASGPGYRGILLEGITGSGKTEVYAAMAAPELAAGRQVLLLVPEIGLAPQLLQRLRDRLGVPPVVLHSDLPDGERTAAWLAARRGTAPLIVGTRSAVLAPLHNPGLIVVDEEHDPSYSQQDGFRYSARDLAVVRARAHGIPVVLGSATPSLETLHNATAGRYHHLTLPARAAGAGLPAMEIVDIRSRPLDGGLSAPMRQAVSHHLRAGGQVLLFLNRRGFAPVVTCHSCGWVAECNRCDARLTIHRSAGQLRCHHCGYTTRIPPHCPSCRDTELHPLGPGTERLEAALAAHFPDVEPIRIDRDTTRRRGELAARLERVRSGEARILIGTQMLAKGHHFPEVTLVGIVDTDQGLFGADFRSLERLGQLVLQVAGRAGRGDQRGQVLLQTRHPEHPMLHVLLEQGYAAFAARHLEERRAAGLPPFTALAVLRAEAVDAEAPMAYLDAAVEAALKTPGSGSVECLGPVPASMERREGRYRAQLLIRADSRRALQAFLNTWAPGLSDLPGARRVRWSLDVDPADLV